MLFLIEYDRRKGQIVSKRVFPGLQRRVAQEARLDLELALNRNGTVHEVVLLEAASEAALRKTHRRYFENLAELAGPPGVNRKPC